MSTHDSTSRRPYDGPGHRPYDSTGRHPYVSTGRARGRRRVAGVLAAAGALVLAATGCAATTSSAAAGSSAPAGAGTRTPAHAPTRTAPAVPEPAVLAEAKVNVGEGATVGVGMPISVTFPRPVPRAQRAEVERRLTVGTDPAVGGAWSWVKDRNLLDGQRVDYRPPAYWKPGTRVTLHVGTKAVRHFTIGRALTATVDVRSHTMTVTEDGKPTTRIPVTAGRPGLDTWNGTMVVLDKQPKVFMDSRTVNLGDAYHDYYFWAVHVTTSGTYLHQNPNADTYAGRSNVTHGCVGLSTDGTAERFYRRVIPGDVIRVTGSKETVATGNGYGDWNLSWSEWLANSAVRHGKSGSPERSQ
ncbi:L,D-transpeptidase [Streptomyces actinomycinicus]|uniref:L,D-transpeptidase n=1 Tax=Streptomyces actinomycinicus TaxID=1695166 RepID=UPI0027DAA9DA|nr:L,D-transpeptidase [Streptomyces actinomycinicus]